MYSYQKRSYQPSESPDDEYHRYPARQSSGEKNQFHYRQASPTEDNEHYSYDNNRLYLHRRQACYQEEEDTLQIPEAYRICLLVMLCIGILFVILVLLFLVGLGCYTWGRSSVLNRRNTMKIIS